MNQANPNAIRVSAPHALDLVAVPHPTAQTASWIATLLLCEEAKVAGAETGRDHPG